MTYTGPHDGQSWAVHVIVGLPQVQPSGMTFSGSLVANASRGAGAGSSLTGGSLAGSSCRLGPLSLLKGGAGGFLVSPRRVTFDVLRRHLALGRGAVDLAPPLHPFFDQRGMRPQIETIAPAGGYKHRRKAKQKVFAAPKAFPPSDDRSRRDSRVIGD